MANKLHKTSKKSLAIQTVLYFSILSTIFIILYGISAYNVYQNNMKELKYRESERVETAFKVVNSKIKQIESDLIFLSKLPYSDLGKGKEHLSYIYKNYSMAKSIYDQIRFIDSNGDEKLRINNNSGNPKVVDDKNLQNKKNRYYYYDTYKLNEDDIFMSPLDLNMENGKVEEPFKPMIRLGTPIFDSSNNKIGIVLVNYLGINIIDEIKDIFNRADSKIETFPLLINREGYFILGRTPQEEWGFMFNKEENNIKTVCMPAWDTISNKEKGKLFCKDGLFTFITVYPNYQYSSNIISNGKQFWKLVSYIPDESLKTLKINSIKLTFRTFPYVIITALILSFFISLNRVLRKKSEKQVETLSGLLPVCSSCHKIRDDSGYWEQIESYVSTHSEANFTHSVCPTCAKELYPDLDIYED